LVRKRAKRAIIASQGTRTLRAARPDPSLRKERLLQDDNQTAPLPIKAFAGPEYEKAVYYPKDKKFLLELDPNVTHYEVLQSG